jgi:hypothetical protein
MLGQLADVYPLLPPWQLTLGFDNLPDLRSLKCRRGRIDEAHRGDVQYKEQLQAQRCPQDQLKPLPNTSKDK